MLLLARRLVVSWSATWELKEVEVAVNRDARVYLLKG
jgi:hypothetical protein